MNLFHKCVSSCSKILCNGPNNFHFIRYYNFFFFWPHCAACTILVPWPGIEPMLCAVKAWSLNHWVAREVPNFFFFFIVLFIYLRLLWVFISVRGLSLVAASGGHSPSRCAGLSLSRPLLLRSAGSVIVAHGPSRSAARGILQNQGSNPCPLHWQADSQPLRHQGSPPIFFNIC